MQEVSKIKLKLTSLIKISLPKVLKKSLKSGLMFLILAVFGLSISFISISVSAQTSQLSSLTNPVNASVTAVSANPVSINELELRNSLLDLGGKFVLYATLVFIYWLVLRAVHWITVKIIKNSAIVKLINVSSTLLFIVASLVTILFAFVGNLTFLITSFGVLSAALVVALQDFVSSFFAWVMIKLKHQYKLQDIIELNSSQGSFTGKVSEIGVFRTSLKEQFGGQGLNKELYTGKTISFPNNLILKEGLINHTMDNKILWHTINITITYESDYEKANLILNEIALTQFEYALDHKDSLLDNVYNLKSVYKPRIYLNIGSDGVEFTIWFSARRDRYRESVEEYSRQIMHKFKANKIQLAYRTSRVIATPGQVNPVTIV